MSSVLATTAITRTISAQIKKRQREIGKDEQAPASVTSTLRVLIETTLRLRLEFCSTPEGALRRTDVGFLGMALQRGWSTGHAVRRSPDPDKSPEHVRRMPAHVLSRSRFQRASEKCNNDTVPIHRRNKAIRGSRLGRVQVNGPTACTPNTQGVSMRSEINKPSLEKMSSNQTPPHTPKSPTEEHSKSANR